MSAAALAYASLLCVAAGALLWFRRLGQVHIPANRAPFVLAWGGGALLGGWAWLEGASGVAAAAAAMAALAGVFLCVLVAISRQRTGDAAIRLGDRLPDFSGTDEHGRPFELTTLAGRPILLKFFRGHW